MSTKVEPQSQMTRGHGGGGGGTRIPVAIRSVAPAPPPVSSSSSPPSKQPPPPPASKSSPPSSQKPSPPSSKSSPPPSQPPPPPAPTSKSSPPSSQPSPPSSQKPPPPSSKSSPPPSQPPSSKPSPPSSKSSAPSSQPPPPPSSKPPPPSSQPPPPPSQPPSPSSQPPPPQPLPQLTAAPSKSSSEVSAQSGPLALLSPQPSSVTTTTTTTTSSSSSQPSPQQSSTQLPNQPTSSSPSSSLLPTPTIKPIALTSPTEAERALVPRARRRKAKEESSLVLWTPEALPVTRAGPPPEDRLSGANTARPAAAAASSMSLSVYTARTEAGTKGEVMTVSARVSLQPRVYREGMQYMRDRIDEILDDLDYAQCQYYHTDRVDDDLFVDYLKTCDKHFLRANTELRKRSVQLEVIDSETRLVSLLNKLREDEDFDPETVRYLTEYWENVKDTASRLKAVVAKFEANVLTRLKRNYIGDSSGDSHLEVCSSFTADISAHMSDLDRTLSNAHILLKSFHSGLHQNLFDKSSFADLIVVSCDLKAFPLLRLVSDVAGKVSAMCEVARQWLGRDEQFMQEIQSVIREARHRTKQRTEDLKSQKEKQKKYVKSVKAANILLQNNRDKLHRIETELHVLEGQLNESERDKQHHYDQLLQKESMVDFLQITLSQTKRNYNLQATRVKLSRQVKDLKELLTSMERDLDSIQGEIQVKAEEKVRLSEKVEHHEKSYDALRCDMDRFSSRVEQLQSEVTDLSGQLVQLEIIHNLKASPEKVEEIYDRPSTVKLAPSLKEKIKERKRKVKPK